MTNTEKFIQLVTENPNLPIVPMVDGEVCIDDCHRWMGEFGYCYVGEYAFFGDRVYFDRYDLEEDYYDFNCEFYSFLSDEEIDKSIKNETKDWWTKAIIVNIDMM